MQYCYANGLARAIQSARQCIAGPQIAGSDLQPAVRVALAVVRSTVQPGSCRHPSAHSTRPSSPPGRSSATRRRKLWSQLDATREAARRAPLARKSSSLGWLFGARKHRPSRSRASNLRRGRPRQDHADGPVLRGERRCMRKRRAHFHEFMADVHERVHALPAEDQSTARSTATIRSGSPPRRSPRRPGCSASTNSTSPTSPTR